MKKGGKRKWASELANEDENDENFDANIQEELNSSSDEDE